MPSTSRLLTAAVILGGLIAYGSLQSNAATGPEFIRITDRQFSYKRVDIGARGVSPGDQEIIYYTGRSTGTVAGCNGWVTVPSGGTTPGVKSLACVCTAPRW